VLLGRVENSKHQGISQHAEENLIRNLEDNWDLLPHKNDGTIDHLTIFINNSPCGQSFNDCSLSLFKFCMRHNIKLSIKILSFYSGESNIYASEYYQSGPNKGQPRVYTDKHSSLAQSKGKAVGDPVGLGSLEGLAMMQRQGDIDISVLEPEELPRIGIDLEALEREGRLSKTRKDEIIRNMRMRNEKLKAEIEKAYEIEFNR
jgi:hypothetical protein